MIEFFSARPPWYVGGLALGAIVIALQWSANLPLGATGACGGFVDWIRNPKASPSWRAYFFLGLLGGALFYALTQQIPPHWTHGSFDLRYGSSIAIKAALLTTGGFLIGFGARTAGGCTSGHGICGVSRGSLASLVATATFTGTAMIVAQTLNFLFPPR